MKLLVAFCFLAWSAVAQTSVHVSSITQVATDAKHPVWCKANCGTNVIAYQQLVPNSGNVYQIWTMDATGGNQTCLSCTPFAQGNLPGATCGPSGNSQCTQGNPEWAPNGDIVFQQQRSGCTLDAVDATSGIGSCNDLWECDPNFTTRCTSLAVSGTGSASGFLQYRFSADGTKLFGGHIVVQSGGCTGVLGEALAIRIFNWTNTPSATPIVYTGANTLDGDILPGPSLPGNLCGQAFVEGATTYPTSVEPTTKTLFFSMAGNTTQALRQYSIDISSGDADTIMSTLKIVSPGGIEWSEMGNINPQGTHYAFTTSTCTPYPPPVTIKNVALDLAIQNPGGGDKLCATTYNTPGTPMYYNVDGAYVNFDDFDWGPADGVHNNQIVANVSDGKTFNNIYLYSLVFETQVGNPVLNTLNPVVNGASFTPEFASGEWVTIFGQNLSPDTREWGPLDFAGNNLPTELDGVSVSINGIPAYVYYISPGQIDVLAPDDPTTGSINVQVTTNGLNSTTVSVNKQAYVPAFFIDSVGGDKYIVATHANGTPVGATTLYPGTSTPAQPGEEIILLGTGFGATNPPTPTGQTITSPHPLAQSVTITIGGVEATVDYAGVTESGVDQFNVVVPPGLSPGDQLVVATIGAVQSQANAYITVQ
jgi:uncharacterized protein (TIGR03437 family)